MLASKIVRGHWGNDFLLRTSIASFFVAFKGIFRSRAQPLFFNAKSSKATEEKQVPEESVEGLGKEEAVPEVSEIEKTLRAENEKLLEKVKDIDDKFKRALAEGENTRIRMRKQVEDAKIFGIQSFCKDILDVADVLTTAIETVPKDQVNSNEILKNLFTGVEMTEQQLQAVFRRHGLTKINPLGEKFNPNEHQAMFEAEIPGKEPGTVSVVTKVGYKLHDRTIRAAMVGVVKRS